MKKTIKLIPAIVMLLVSAILVSTSTYAWFSMNNRVTAESMSIQATADNPYLLISETESGTYDTDAAAMVLAPAAATALKLVTPLNLDATAANNVDYYADAAAKAAGTTTDNPTRFTNAAGVLWGTAMSNNPAEVQASNVPTLVDSGDLADYVQKSELWFKVAASDVTGNGSHLRCSQVTFDDGTNSIAASGRVLIVSESGKYQLFKLVDGAVTSAETGSDSWLIETITNTPVKLTCFFYFDGTDASAYTNNATDLSGVTAQFVFVID